MHLVVIGGGITGLVAAFRASERRGVEVTLLEATGGVGGKIDTIALGDARIELSADSFLPRDDRPLRLCRDIGLAEELVSPADFGAWTYQRDRLHRFPAGTVLGFPASLPELFRTELLTPLGKLRAGFDLVHGSRLTGSDLSVADFTRRRLGPQVLERLVDPILAGTRAGDTAEMSLAAAIPPVDATARSSRSVIRGLARTRRTGGYASPRFLAPREGMHRIVDALEDAMPSVDIRRGARVRSLRKERDGFAIELEDEELPADAAIVATPSGAAAEILQPLSAEVSTALAAICHASSAVINLLFPGGSVELPGSGSGVLIPSSERMTLSGCTWFSSKWPQHSAPDGSITIRCFVGRGHRDPALELGDRDLVGVVLQDLARVLTVSASPEATHLARWDGGMPIYTVGHLDRVAGIETELSRIPRLALAGSSYRGSGIPDCIAQAELAVSSVTGSAAALG